jgi:PAS domain S-box-containing protein
VVDLASSRITYANPAMCAMLGCDAEEATSLCVTDLHPPELARKVIEDLAAMAHGQRPLALDVPCLTRSGKRVDADISGAPAPSQGRESVVLLYRDITEAKRDRDERERLRARVQRAQRLESLGVLAGGIAHDFNNILAAILGYTELTLETMARGTPGRGRLERVMAAGERARDLVGQILAFSRQAEMDQRPIRVQTLVHEALRFLRGSIPRNIEVREELDEACCAVVADPTRLHQVVMNLCANALYAMRGADGVLSVELREVTVSEEEAARLGCPRPGRHARLTVTDTGCGIDAAAMERIFEPFFTTKPVGEGTGLGLSTAHGIVATHFGAIVARSDVGRGSTFEVYLPGADHELADAAEAQTRATGAGRRVLFVDDERALGLMAREMLGALGYDVTVCGGGSEALEALAADPEGYDLLIADYAMPRMTGLQLAQAVRGLRPHMPVLLTTSLGRAADAAQCEVESQGMGEVLLKPYTLRQLDDAVHRAMGVRGAPRR